MADQDAGAAGALAATAHGSAKQRSASLRRAAAAVALLLPLLPLPCCSPPLPPHLQPPFLPLLLPHIASVFTDLCTPLPRPPHMTPDAGPMMTWTSTHREAEARREARRNGELVRKLQKAQQHRRAASLAVWPLAPSAHPLAAQEQRVLHMLHQSRSSMPSSSSCEPQILTEDGARHGACGLVNDGASGPFLFIHTHVHDLSRARTRQCVHNSPSLCTHTCDLTLRA